MEKEFAPYEIALELKELGFDEPCCANMFDYSKPHINTNITNRVRFYNVQNSKDFNKQYVPIHLINIDIFVSLPLYQQVFRWFREKHKLYSIILYHTDNRVEFEHPHYFRIYEAKYNGKKIYISKEFKNHEEAQFECIKKLIEIIKN